MVIDIYYIFHYSRQNLPLPSAPRRLLADSGFWEDVTLPAVTRVLFCSNYYPLLIQGRGNFLSGGQASHLSHHRLYPPPRTVVLPLERLTFT